MRSHTSPGLRARRLAAVALAGALVVGLGACGGDADSSEGAPAAAAGADGVDIEGVGSVEADDTLTKMLPAEVASAEKITVATNAPYPPFIDFVEEGNTEDFTGLDYDLLQAIAARLGLAAPFEQQPFDGLVPGLKAGKSDAIVGGITDNFERQATATFVDYTASGTGILVAGGNPEGIATMDDLCGRPVSAQKGSKQVDLLADFSKETCGSSPIEVTTFPQNTDAVQALLANKVDAVVATQVNLVDEAKKLSGKAEVVEDPDNPNGYQASPNGIGFDKADADLATAVQAALQSLMDDGTYAKILAKWEMEPIGLDKATIDAAID
ncbi:transporter substrate-binding domain-containing protein [Nocardioides sp. MAH-18]|uniref:Transporter substrate-binding domain-containing protein n=1 Tax=Nocardioides agri TaxID=2682843 RepID=A0A6L6XXZ3_9ACTN|nr:MULTISPECIES: ABC transporter substrate-binding protein [unclassified Nocardioides]MBA2955485.1 ABC transporter substrate-binding protein [Nocardioides sp. CGMCC 1.13656]MVQ50335.1 transporter substrate-binding domain-containing protein [Nocardioides sp. MAH-18]